MINDIKMSFKILKYGINVKSGLIFAGIFFVLGFILEMVGSSGINAFYMGLVSIYIGQIAHSVVQSTMVQSSPYKKAMQTKLPALVMMIIVLVYNTLNILWKIVLLQVNPEREEEFILGTLLAGVMTIIIMVYFAFAMKLYWPATICFFIVFYSLCFGSGFGHGIQIAGGSLGLNITMTGAAIFSYLGILLACAINYGVSVWLYKKDYAQQNFKKVLDRAK